MDYDMDPIWISNPRGAVALHNHLAGKNSGILSILFMI